MRTAIVFRIICYNGKNQNGFLKVTKLLPSQNEQLRFHVPRRLEEGRQDPTHQDVLYQETPRTHPPSLHAHLT